MIAQTLAWWLALHGGVPLLPVMILQLDEHPSPSQSAARLLRSELELAGFDASLVTISRPTAPDQGTDTRQRGIELLEDMGQGALVDTSDIDRGYVEIAWRPSSAPGLRWHRLPLRSHERLTSLALEVAEFLNPLLMEWQRLRADTPSDDEEEEAEESSAPDADGVEQEGPTFWWGLGPAMVISNEGIPPALGPSAILGVALTSELAVELDATGAIALSRFSDPRGNAHTGSLHGHLHLVWSPRVSFPVGPRFGAGLGTAAIWADRPASAADNGSWIQFAFEGVVWAAARWQVTPDFVLEPRVGASLTAPHLNLLVENEGTGMAESAAALGRPIIHVSILAIFPS